MRPSMRSARICPSLARATALAILVWLAVAAVAFAEPSPLDQYQQTGRIDPCNPGLYGAGGGAPNDVAQYAPDYLQALQDAKRAGCHHGGGSGGGGGSSSSAAGAAPSTGGGAPPGAAAGTPYVPKPPAPPKVVPTSTARQSIVGGHLPLAAKTDGGTPAPIVALGVMLLVALAALAFSALARRLGWTVGVPEPIRHAGGEAALRMGSFAGSLADWARRRR